MDGRFSVPSGGMPWLIGATSDGLADEAAGWVVQPDVDALSASAADGASRGGRLSGPARRHYEHRFSPAVATAT